MFRFWENQRTRQKNTKKKQIHSNSQRWLFMAMWCVRLCLWCVCVCVCVCAFGICGDRSQTSGLCMLRTSNTFIETARFSLAIRCFKFFFPDFFFILFCLHLTICLHNKLIRPFLSSIPSVSSGDATNVFVIVIAQVSFNENEKLVNVLHRLRARGFEKRFLRA